MNEELFEQATEEIMDGATFDSPCTYGHFDCAKVSGGACSNEAVAERYAELLDESGSVQLGVVAMLPLLGAVAFFTAQMFGSLVVV